MSRKSLIRTSTLPYHVTARTNNREPFPLPLDQAWRILEGQCFEVSVLFGAQVHALVLMNNHFHLLISTPKEDLGEIMMHFMRSSTRALNLLSGRSGHAFCGRYHWTLVNSDVYFAHAFKYVFRNPVRAGVSDTVEEYPFTSLAGLLGLRPLGFPIYFPFGFSAYIRIPTDTAALLKWLNQPFRTEHLQAIRKALKRACFEPPKSGWKRTLEEMKAQLL
ncbi:MAG: transposase [Oligoflexia bacterium]|nr:transposase [Oligoflexia bacterium]